MIDEIRLMATYMTAHSSDKDECSSIAHCIMNKAISSMGGLSDTMPSLSGDEKTKFLKILNGTIDKSIENEFKKNLIIASAVMNGRIEDKTEGADSFSREKVGKSKKIGEMYFSKSQTESVISEKPKSSKGRKKKESYA